MLSIVLPLAPAQALAASAEQSVLINEIRLGGGPLAYGDDETFVEYVTLFNNGDTEVSLEGWVLEYAKNPKPGLGPDFCSAASWKGFENITVAQVSLAGQLAPHSVTSPIVIQLNDDQLGSLRLVNASSPDAVVVHDVVGWGEDAPCKESSPAPVPKKPSSLIRYLSCDTGLPIDTDDNYQDFVLNSTPVPGSIGSLYEESCSDEEPLELECSKAIITELLPNPKGADVGREFIEVHNPTAHELPLQGCQLGLEGQGKPFPFTEADVLGPGEYRAYYDSTTGVTLPNAAGGTVLLIAGQDEFSYSYPGGLKDDIAWADIGGEWQQTNRPTPGAANAPYSAPPGKGADEKSLAPCPVGKFRNPVTNRCKNIETTKVLAPCGEGKERNPATNRCRSISAALASLVPCKPGQERNPATNRCRSVVSASSSLKPCNPGQERNPETNRCRKVAAATTSLKPCKEGQERNPETNRCRKIHAAATANEADDQKSEQKNLINYGLLGLVGASAVGYGVYEYRNDFRYKLSVLKSRFFLKNSGK